jgi:dipeptidyl aminopeptidase/acylaminoacyl peptidase
MASSSEPDKTGSISLEGARTFRLPGDCLVPYCCASPNGGSVAFTTTTPGKDNMSQVDLSALDTKTGLVQRITYSGYIYNASWSPDSRFLLYEYQDPDTHLPSVRAYDARNGLITPFDIHTYLKKTAWYTPSVLLAGLPSDIETALNRTDKATPDSLVFCSPATGAYAYLVPANTSKPQSFTNPVVAGDWLYYSGSLFLRKLDLAGVKPTLRAFEYSDSTPVQPNTIEKGGSK